MAAIETLTIVLRASGQQALNVLNRLSISLKNLGLSAFNKLIDWGKKGLLALAAAGAAAATAIAVLGAKQEQTRLRLQTLLGSVKYGNALLAQMQQFANVTPFSTSEVVKAGQTLLSFGVAARDVQDELKMVGDIASGTGKALDDLAAIYGKSLIKGKADAETLNQMSEAGIPIIRELARQYGVAETAVYGLASAGKISGDNIRQAFRTMTSVGGQFYSMMAKQSRTVSGLFSTIYGKIQTIAATIGEQLAPLASVVLGVLIEWTDVVGEMAADGRLLNWFGEVFKMSISVAESFAHWSNGLSKCSIEFQYFMHVMSWIYNTTRAMIDLILMAISVIIEFLGVCIKSLKTFPDPIFNVDWKKEFSVSNYFKEGVKERLWGGSAVAQKKIVDLMNNTPTSNADSRDEWIANISAKATAAVDSFLKSSHDKIKAQNEDAKVSDLPGTIASAIVSEMAPDVTTTEDASTAPNSLSGTAEKMQQATDALGRLGLYNTTSATERLDLLRNNLLRQIAEKIASPQPLYQL